MKGDYLDLTQIFILIWSSEYFPEIDTLFLVSTAINKLEKYHNYLGHPITNADRALLDVQVVTFNVEMVLCSSQEYGSSEVFLAVHCISERGEQYAIKIWFLVVQLWNQ